MCGINGIYNISKLDSPLQEMEQMSAKQKHRGPDASGTYVNDFVAFGHSRLSIIDLEPSSNQPFHSSDKKFILIFNGEIYNYKEIRESLPDYHFRTNSDTEVVLAAYQTWGTNCVHQFNGMFAFAIWDVEKCALFIARDRLGIKPLYVYDNNESIVFSSEIRSLMGCSLVKKKIDKDSFVDYLRYNTVHAPKTIIEGVKMLMPGHYIWVSDDEYKNEPYWDINKYINQKSDNQSYEEIKIDVKDRLTKSVKRRLVADVPFGAFLSGGIDSSAIVALMSEVSDEPVKTFNISFAEEAFSEAKYARIIAKKYKTDHTEIKLTPADFLAELPSALSGMDHPSGDGPNSFIVSKATKEAGVTMALSGLGGDELFAGYDIFPRAVSLLDKKWVYSFPIGIRRLMGKALKIVKPTIASDKIVETITQKYLELPFYYPINRQVLNDELISKLTGIGILPENAVYRIGLNNIDVNAPGFKSPFLSKVTYMEMNTYMQNVLLRDTDQMSMAHSLEVRVPFLDHELVEYVYGVADEYKFPYSPKKLLVDSLGDLLPKEIVNRPKMGFTFPWEQWMKNELKDFCIKNLTNLVDRELLDKKQLWDMWNRFLKGNQKATWSRLWPLVVLGFWLEENEVEV
jgi:asparagine synthase (glutamine-hydrolysing)